MHKYEIFFRDLPHGRPPDRGVEHNIVLDEGTSPIQIPPYRHPNKFRDDIEKAIQELLYLRLIMLAIMHALAKFRQYLVGNKFVVKTNHNSLRHFITQKDLNERKKIR